MTTIVTGVRLQVENGSGFTADLKEIRAAVSGVAAAEGEAAAASGQLVAATSNVASSARVAAAELVQAAAASGQLSGAANNVATSASLIAAEMGHAAAASGQLSVATAGVTSSASVAAAELVHAAQAANDNAIGLVKATQAGQQYASMAAQLRSELDPMFAVQQRYDQELARADALLGANEISEREFAAAVKLANDNLRAGHAAIFQTNDAQERLTRNLGLQRAGWQGVGFQLQDVFASYASGTHLTTIFAQQSGQLTSSIAMIAQAGETSAGTMGRFATFMAGPWGIAVGVAVSVIGALATALYDADKAADKATDEMLDLSGGLAALEKNALAAQSAMDKLRDSLAQSSPMSDAADKSVKVLISAGAELAKVNRDIAATKQLLQSPTLALGGADAGMAMVNRLALLDKQRATIQKTIDKAKSDLSQIQSDGAAANLQQAAKNRLDELGKKEKADKPNNAAARAAERRAEYGEDTAKKIAGIRDQFSELPSTVSRANTAMRELDDIASDLAARPLTPGVKGLIAALGDARTAVSDSLNKPFNDYLEQAREAAEIDKLLLQGRTDEAHALQVVLGLKEKQGPLDQAQLDAVLATVQAQRENSMLLRDQQALISSNVAAVQDFRSALTRTVADALRGRFSISNILSSLGNSWINGVSQKLVEGMFGDTLRQLEAQATGADKVEAAGVRMAGSLDDGGKAVRSFADTVNEAIVAIEGARSAASPSTSSPTNLLEQIVAGMDQQSAASSGAGAAPEGTGDEIVVVANKSKKVDPSGIGGLLVDAVKKTLGQIGVDIPDVVTQGIKGALGKIETSIPAALQGAFTGAAASKLILGNGGSSVGAGIGGAIGQKMGEKFLSSGLEKIGGKLLGSFAGPLGGILGGVLGGALGGLFKKTQWGSATITNGDVSSAGNKQDYTAGASTAAGTVSGAINQIADRLGASVGKYAVSIGLTNGNWNVNGGVVNGKIGTKWQRDTIDFKKDEAGALSWAIGNAISDGAIQGISAAVAKALKSSTDIDKALAEALKVQEVELLIGGIGAQLEKSFRDFENQAKERLRVAREYGFDVLKMEEQNAKDRLKLAEQLLKDQVGSLQDLITEMTSGSLYEGSAVDRRNALKAEIATAQAKVDAGEEGAADTLAKLLQQFNEVSKEVYGTTGGFAADRATILDAANDAVEKAKQQIAAAQAATDPAVAAALDENNDQNAQMLDELAQSNSYLAMILSGMGASGASGLAALARTS